MAKKETIPDLDDVLNRLNRHVTTNFIKGAANPFVIDTTPKKVWCPGSYFTTGYYADGDNILDELMPNKGRKEKAWRILRQDDYVLWDSSLSCFVVSEEWWRGYTQGVKPEPNMDPNRTHWRKIPGRHLSGYKLSELVGKGYADYIARNSMDELERHVVEYSMTYTSSKHGTRKNDYADSIYLLSSMADESLPVDKVHDMFLGEFNVYLEGRDYKKVDTAKLQEFFCTYLKTFYGAKHTISYFGLSVSLGYQRSLEKLHRAFSDVQIMYEEKQKALSEIGDLTGITEVDDQSMVDWLRNDLAGKWQSYSMVMQFDEYFSKIFMNSLNSICRMAL